MEKQMGIDIPSAAADLRWYFDREATGPLKSSFPGMVRRIAMGRQCHERPRHDPSDELLDAAARAGGIARVLRAVDPQTREHLEQAFGMDVPEEYAMLGDLSGLAPFTQAARDAHRKLGRREPYEEWMRNLFRSSTRAQAAPLLMRILDEARALRGRALACYVAVRRRVGRRG